MSSEKWQHEQMFRAHPDPMWLFTRDSEQIVEVNEAALARYEYSEVEFLQMKLADLLPPKDREDSYKDVALLVPGLDSMSIRRHCSKTGKLFYVDVKSYPLATDDGQMVLMIARDISYYVLNDENMREGIRIGTWRVDVGSDTVFWSPETAAIHGMPNIFSRTLQEMKQFVLPSYRKELSRLLAECESSGNSFDITIELNNALGRDIWVRVGAEPIKNKNEDVVAIQGYMQDVTNLVVVHENDALDAPPLAVSLENISDAFAMIDSHWRVTYLNRRGEELVKKSRREVLGTTFWEQFPHIIGSPFETKIRNAMRNHESLHTVEYETVLGLWLEINAYPSSQGVSMYLRDVTAEHTLNSQLHLLESAVSHLNDVLVITKAEPIDGPNGPEIVYVNDAFERVTGYSRQEALGRTPRFLQGKDTSRAELDRIREAMEAKRAVRSELLNYKKDGSQIDLEIDLVPLTNAKGQHTHFVAVERDISDRKRLEKALHENTERIRIFSETTTDIVWDWDCEKNSLWWSQSLLSTFGLEPKEFEKTDAWLGRLHPNDKDRVTSNLRAAMQSNFTSVEDEYSVQHADGSYRVVSDRGCIVRNADGKAIRVIGSIVDITERKNLDNQLFQAQKMEAIGKLTGGVAHDFNNLLTIILGNAEMLLEKNGVDSQERLMTELIVNAAQNGAKLVDRLLAFARQQPLEPKVVNVNSLIKNMKELFRGSVRENIEIEYNLASKIWMAELDSGQLEAALLNLIINARDAMADGGQLTIETQNISVDEECAQTQLGVPIGEYVRVSVCDHGAGIDALTLKRVFEPFFTTKSQGKSSGLGLSMVYGFVNQSGGHARIYSQVGEGTTVHLYFPCVHQQASEPEVPANKETAVGGSEFILVVEDYDLVRQHLVTQLKSYGYKVLSANNGPRAIEIIKAHPEIDLLFTDVVMPGGMNGRELADAARLIRKELKVLYTSGYTESAIVHQGRLDPNVELLHKPYRRQQMAMKVRKVLDNEV